MTKLRELYKRLEPYQYSNDCNISLEWLQEGSALEQLKLTHFDVEYGHFLIAECEDLWIIYITHKEEHYHKPVMVDDAMAISEFLDYCVTYSQISPRLNIFEKSIEIELNESKTIDELLATLLVFKEQYKGYNILCRGFNSYYGEVYLDCSAYRIESDDEYDARLLVEHEKAEKKRLLLKAKVELKRLRNRDKILKELELLENQKKELYDKLESLLYDALNH
jgi:hypothetical protein